MGQLGRCVTEQFVTGKRAFVLFAFWGAELASEAGKHRAPYEVRSRADHDEIVPKLAPRFLIGSVHTHLNFYAAVAFAEGQHAYGPGDFDKALLAKLRKLTRAAHVNEGNLSLPDLADRTDCKLVPRVFR